MLSPEFLSAVVLLILVLDPVGNLPLVSSLLAKVDPARRRKVVLRECAIAYGVLLLFLFAGRPLLELMRLSEKDETIETVAEALHSLRVQRVHLDAARAREAERKAREEAEKLAERVAALEARIKG